MELLDNVKEWLDSSNIAYSEGPLNLNWPTIMKTVIQDPKAFFQDGGWSFLGGDSDEDDGEVEEDESEFEASDFGEESDGSASDESDFSDGNASADEGSGASDVDSGGEWHPNPCYRCMIADVFTDDWDEMEDEAEMKDSKPGRSNGDDKKNKKR